MKLKRFVAVVGGLKNAMFLVGARKTFQLATAPVVITGKRASGSS